MKIVGFYHFSPEFLIFPLALIIIERRTRKVKISDVRSVSAGRICHFCSAWYVLTLALFGAAVFTNHVVTTNEAFKAYGYFGKSIKFDFMHFQFLIGFFDNYIHLKDSGIGMDLVARLVGGVVFFVSGETFIHGKEYLESWGAGEK